MRVIFLWFLMAGLVLSSCDARKEKNPKTPKPKKNGTGTASSGNSKKDMKNVFTCKDDTTFIVTADDFKRRGFNFSCPDSGLISNATVVGYNGSCQGLDPDLYAKVLNCHWQQECNLTYRPASFLKIFNGNITCYSKQADNFTFKFECTAKDVEVHTLNKTIFGKEHANKNGIVKSHVDHPWVYERGHTDSSLTLKRPQNLKTIKIKFRTLQLSDYDYLYVNVTGSDKKSTKSNKITAQDDTSKALVFPDVESLSISLYVQPFSHGEEGYTACFEWAEKENQLTSDPCQRLFVAGTCGAKTSKGAKSKGDKKKQNSESKNLHQPKKGKEKNPKAAKV